jgi:hypothetical protein
MNAAVAGLLADDLGVHRAGVGDRPISFRRAPRSTSAMKARVLSGSASRYGAVCCRSASMSGLAQGDNDTATAAMSSASSSSTMWKDTVLVQTGETCGAGE